ncbi:MAG TPA: hypothetical protein VL357_10960 [Rariglobus sp.]|jgi:hypothetical protein|nr:hypothetical protein [Rariglobus sp.]
MKFVSILSVVILAALAGCVPAPIILTDSETKISYEDTTSSLAIKEIYTWHYIPLIASAEGPTKYRIGEDSYEYFITQGEKTQKLKFLMCQSKWGGWYDFTRLKSTENLWVALKDTDYTIHKNTALGPFSWARNIEVCVFSINGISRKMAIIALDENTELRCPAFSLRPSILTEDRFIDYMAPEGLHRLDVLSGLDTSFSPNSK